MKEIGIIQIIASGARSELKCTVQITNISAITSIIRPTYFSLLSKNQL